MSPRMDSGSKTLVAECGPTLRADASRNRERVLAVAREVFRERGLSGSLQEIARRAGVGIGTVYNRFGSREELIDAAYLEAVQQQHEETERAWAISDPWLALTELLTAMAETMVTDRGFTDFCVRGFVPGSLTELTKQRGQELADAVIQRAKESGQLRSDVGLVDILLLVWSTVAATESIRAALPEAWRLHLAVLFDGLQAQNAHLQPGTGLTTDAIMQIVVPGSGVATQAERK
jgi:AcrR family transcriptional regulator